MYFLSVQGDSSFIPLSKRSPKEKGTKARTINVALLQAQDAKERRPVEAKVIKGAASATGGNAVPIQAEPVKETPAKAKGIKEMLARDKGAKGTPPKDKEVQETPHKTNGVRMPARKARMNGVDAARYRILVLRPAPINQAKGIIVRSSPTDLIKVATIETRLQGRLPPDESRSKVTEIIHASMSGAMISKEALVVAKRTCEIT